MPPAGVAIARLHPGASTASACTLNVFCGAVGSFEKTVTSHDFKPSVGHRFNLRGEWGGVLDCEVLAIEPQRSLAYTWNFTHEDAAYDPVVKEGIPLNGEINLFGREERHRHIGRRLANIYVVDGISAAPEVDLDFADIARVERAAVECPVDIISDRPRKDRAANACEDGKHERRGGSGNQVLT